MDFAATKVEVILPDDPEDITENYTEEEYVKPKPLVKQPSKTYLCTFLGCNAKFLRPSKLERHLCMHTGERPFVCDFKDCDKAYTNSCYLKRHKMTHNAVKEIFLCDVCKMTFTKQHNLKRHYKRRHDNRFKTYITKMCEICQKEFPTRKILKIHLSEVHERKLYQCAYCPKSFSEPSILQRHLNSSVHKTYHCNICTVFFNKFQELKDHIKREHHITDSEYVCDYCGKTFSRKRTLTLHLQQHTVANIVTCSYEGCNRIYYFQRNLDQHVRIFHMGEKWKCSSCPAQLSTKQKLNEHIKKIHENPRPKQSLDTNKNRKGRQDRGKPNKSAISKLVGLTLPKKVEEDIINRDNIKYEPLPLV